MKHAYFYISLICAALGVFAGGAWAVFAGQDHEYTEIKATTLAIDDARFKLVDGSGEISLKEFIKGKKLVLIYYFAPWCDNSNYEAPFLAKLYDKYASTGLDILGVSNYAPVDEIRSYVEKYGITYTVVFDTTKKDDDSRMASQHYKLRQSAGDTRKWGTPFSLFIVAGRTDKVYVAAGELIADKAEKFIEEMLKAAPSL
jgi:peroxiredoxin